MALDAECFYAVTDQPFMLAMCHYAECQNAECIDTKSMKYLKLTNKYEN